LWYSLSSALTPLGRHEEAIEALKKSLEIKKEFTHAHYALGIAYHHAWSPRRSR
jgi:tetratricopeptide (TPR) repeat protein